MDIEYFQWAQGKLWDFHALRREDETLPEFHVRFMNTNHEIPLTFRQRGNLVNYAFAFDLELSTHLWSQKPTN